MQTGYFDQVGSSRHLFETEVEHRPFSFSHRLGDLALLTLPALKELARFYVELGQRSGSNDRAWPR